MSELTIPLSEEEQTKYNSKKQTEENLPRVYSLAAKAEVPISRDAEAFLILEDFDFKDTLTDSIKAILENSASDDEKELFEEAWNNEREIIRNEVADLNSKLGTTTEVREGLRKSKFVNVTDISELLTAISSEQSVLSSKQRISQYRLKYIEQFKARFQPGSVANSENRKCTESWLNTLTKY